MAEQTEMQLMERLEEIIKKNKINVSDAVKTEIALKLDFFVKNSGKDRFTPIFNEDLKDNEPDHNKLITVPKNNDLYYNYGSGKFIDFGIVRGYDERCGIENEINLSVDFERNLVFATIKTTKLIKGKGNNAVDRYIAGITNYCIPEISSLVRGTPDSIENAHKLSLSNPEEFERTVAKAVIPMSRLDYDCDHYEKYIEDLLNDKTLGDPAERKLILDYFAVNHNGQRKSEIPKIPFPHIHFNSKSYLLDRSKKDLIGYNAFGIRESAIQRKKVENEGFGKLNNDAKGLAINIDKLYDYLVDLSISGEKDDIRKFDLDMPFRTIRNSNVTLSKNEILKNINKINNAVGKFSYDEKVRFCDIIFKRIEKTCGKDGRITKINRTDIKRNNYSEKIMYIFGLLAGKSENDMEIDAITLLSFEALAVKAVYEVSKPEIENVANLNKNSSYRPEMINEIGSCLFDSINSSLGKCREKVEREPGE